MAARMWRRASPLFNRVCRDRAQEHNMSLFEKGKMHLVLFVTRMVVMGI